MQFYYRKIPIKIFPIKNIFAHKIYICQPIFKMFAADFTTNLVLEMLLRKYFASF